MKFIPLWPIGIMFLRTICAGLAGQTSYQFLAVSFTKIKMLLLLHAHFVPARGQYLEISSVPLTIHEEFFGRGDLNKKKFFFLFSFFFTLSLKKKSG